jgi:Tol biopolymer transport system component
MPRGASNTHRHDEDLITAPGIVAPVARLGRSILSDRGWRLAAGAVGAAVLALAAVASASADSLAFEKENNVWLSNTDGSGQYQVTFDGSANAPYETPSQSDAGVVVAIRQTPGQRRQIYRMTQSGQLLNPPINTPAPGTGRLTARSPRTAHSSPTGS